MSGFKTGFLVAAGVVALLIVAGLVSRMVGG